MGLQLGDTAPDFVAQTTEGTIRFHEWIGDSWAVLFSHPKDFTPICTTELGSVAKLSPEFQRRNVKLIGLSVDSVEEHYPWLDDIEETQGIRPDYPLIADTDLNVSKLYGMLEADAEGDAASRCAMDNRTVRSVFVIDPDKRIRLITMYPMQTGRNFTEMLRAVCIGYIVISLILLSGSITKTLRTVRLSIAQRDAASPSASASSIP